MNKPEILAPAGSRESFMAALAAGADAVYLGLKNFSARMQADNFSPSELESLVDLAHSEGRRVYIALNTAIKPDELAFASSLVGTLSRQIKPDALILQDLGALEIAKQAGFGGELHLSTLANITHPLGLEVAKNLGASRVILPRELNIDEIKSFGEACPSGLSLELFVHGALCFCVSGRCYWSSYMGGKSGLRGQCVQPCRRNYLQGSKEGAFFSCLDLSLDVLAKTLLPIPNLVSWKIEGRRKGPHYVYYVASAYKMLRDNPNDSSAKKNAEELLKMALGRTGTKANFLPQRGQSPTVPHSKGEDTASGRFVGRISNQIATQQVKNALKKAAPSQKNQNFSPAAQTDKRGPLLDLILKPWEALLPGDYLRVGSEDKPWHFTFTLRRSVPKAGVLTVVPPRGKLPQTGAPVFLLDRREPELVALLKEWEEKASRFKEKGVRLSEPRLALSGPISEQAGIFAHNSKEPNPITGIDLKGIIPHGKSSPKNICRHNLHGLWLTKKTVTEVSRTVFERIVWWLPPVIWPSEEAEWQRVVHDACQKGGKFFVCNAPWQLALFRNAPQKASHSPIFIAGPFCNATNPLALQALHSLGFAAAIASPELSGKDLLELPKHSPIELGVVISGFWPVGIARHSFEGGRLGEGFSSPKREVFWARHYGQNLWLYPGWPLDISEHKETLMAAGYRIFVHVEEHLPKNMPAPQRTSPFNWDLGLL